MFKKPFKLKSQNQLKNSEKKKFINDIRAVFPALSENNISTLVSSKENVIKTRILTFKEEEVDIYSINKIPMFIEDISNNIKLPTIFMIWKFPSMLPTLTTSSAVLDKLKNGADLFFPGIYLESISNDTFNFKKQNPIAVNLVDNKAVVAVGLSLVSKDDIMDPNKNKEIGKLVKIYHIAGDYLFKMNSDSVILQLGPPEWACSLKDESQSEDLTKNLNPEEKNVDILNTDLENCKLDQQHSFNNELNKDSQEQDEKNLSDTVLEYCFLKALKTIPKDSYPILPATFYAKYILTNIPEGKTLNLKKTKWKKFSTFLQEKSLEGLITLQQVPKNDITIAGANINHKKVKEFVDPYNVVSVTVVPRGDNKTVVQQVYSVSACTLPFFVKFGFKKNDELTRNDVRNHLNDYIRNENLADPNKPDFVILDPILHKILNDADVMSRGSLLSNFLQKMGVQHKVSNCSNGETIVHKGKMPYVEFEICSRVGNKKVTLISNLESYGVNINLFAKELQHKAAASTTITTSVPGKKGSQVQVQGNQIAVAFGILKEKYKLTEKCVKGLEKALKKEKTKSK